METQVPRVLLDGLVFPEGPRWHAGKLWLSDILGTKVMAVDLEGRAELVATVPGAPSGLGFLPNGQLLIASMRDRRLLCLEAGELRTAADLGALARGLINDMVVDTEGRAYVGDMGFDVFGGEPPAPGRLLLATPDGAARVAADDMTFPNGAVITPDGGTLIVAESFAHRLTAFDVQPDGSLTNRQLFADLEERTPDGTCLDAAGGVWVGCIETSEFVRVVEGGAVTHRIPVPGRLAQACMLGGEDRRTLFLLTAVGTIADLHAGNVRGAVETVRVETPGAGLP